MSRQKLPHLGEAAHVEASAASTLDEIDREIEALYQRIQILRFARNALTLINRLPPELLTRIFFLVQGDWTIQSSVKKSLPRDFTNWIAVTHVSQYWRDVAVGCAGLWSTIPIRNQGYLDAALSRSKSVPLSMELGDVQHEQLPLVEQAFRQLERVRQLHIAPGQWSTYAVFLLVKPALSLESFSIGHHHSLGLPRDLFAGSAPQLKSLALSGCGFNWNSLTFPNLTTITILRPDNRVSPEILVRVFQDMPRLKEVTLEDALSGAIELYTSAKTSCMLSLDRLVFRDIAFKAVHRFLSLVTFAKTVRFQFITAGDVDLGEESFPKILRAYLDASNNAKSISTRSIIFGCGTSFCFDTWTSFYHEEKEPTISLRFSGLGTYDHLSEDWLRASLMLPHNKVQSVRALAPVSQEAWNAYLPSIPRLFHIRVLGTGGRTFLDWFVHNLSGDGERSTPPQCDVEMADANRTVALTEKPGSSPKLSSPSPPSPNVIPALEYISFYDVDFNGIDLGKVCTALSRRRQTQERIGKKLKLIISTCHNLTDPMLETIRPSVTDIRRGSRDK